MKLSVKIGSTDHKVTLPEQLLPGQTFLLQIDGHSIEAQWDSNARTLFWKLANETFPCERSLQFRNSQVSANDHGDVTVEVEFGATKDRGFSMRAVKAVVDYDIPGQANRSGAKQAKGLTLRSQITGKILKVLVKVGDTVEVGDGLMVIEAMKMENRLFASQGGRITNLSVQEGESVATGRELLKIE